MEAYQIVSYQNMPNIVAIFFAAKNLEISFISIEYTRCFGHFMKILIKQNRILYVFFSVCEICKRKHIRFLMNWFTCKDTHVWQKFPFTYLLHNHHIFVTVYFVTIKWKYFKWHKRQARNEKISSAMEIKLIMFPLKA